MPLILLFIGAIIAVAAFNNAQGTLATELETDVPPFLKWGLAVFAVGGLGWIPGFEKPSRWLLALVFVVIVLKNYANIIAGFQALGQGTAQTAQPTAASATPALAYASNPASPQITSAEVTGTGSIPAGATSAQAVNINASSQTPVVQSSFGAYDPENYLAAFESGFGGFGGIA